MKRFYILKDGEVIASASTKEDAMQTVRSYQKLETHYLLKANFSIIYGEEEFVPYT